MLQNNVALMYVANYISASYSQCRTDGDLAEFLPNEIQSFPHSLSNFGKFHLPRPPDLQLQKHVGPWAKLSASARRVAETG